jgi:signal transduction histidine kinase
MMSLDGSQNLPAVETGLVNILLVDDEVRNLDVLESILSSPDYHLVRAQAAQEALMALIDGEFAVIVLDIQMPGTNGIELAHLIKQRKRTKYIPIIFLTAYFQEDKDIIQGYEVGAVDYLTKPVDSKILKSKIAVFVELFKKNRELDVLNRALESEIARRENAEQALRQTNNELEARVLERTAELTRANREAVAASRAKDDFLAALSHELRTPLNPVLLLASDSAENLQLPAEVRLQFATIRNNVELEARLIDDLLDITRITHGKLLLNMDWTDVHAVLKEAIATVRFELDEKQISLTLRLAEDQSVMKGDAVRLQQIFWNVLKNAVKFNTQGGEIRVETSIVEESGKMTIKVIDSGIGMTSGEMIHIFNAFSQGHHAGAEGTHRFGGLGLGLTISRMLVELHSGVIFATSDGRDKGSTFVIELPLVQSDARNGLSMISQPSTRNGVQAGSKKKLGMRILLVEDHEPTRTALTHLLTDRDCKVLAAKSVAEAQALAQQQTFDLVVSDIGLPDGNGYALMSELRDNFGLKGIALTGYGMEQDVARGQNAGFVAYLIKPVRVEYLEKALYDASIVA